MGVPDFFWLGGEWISAYALTPNKNEGEWERRKKEGIRKRENWKRQFTLNYMPPTT